MLHVPLDIDIRRSEAGVASTHVDGRREGLPPHGARVGEEVVDHLKAEVGHGGPQDTWFRAYLKANLLMPQTYDGGAVFIAHAVLAQGGFAEFQGATRLSVAQLARARQAMEAAHRLRRIPAGGQAYLQRAREHGEMDMSRTIEIDDDRLHYIWNRFHERATMLVNALAERPDGLFIAEQWVAGWRSKECRALLRQYRAHYDRRLDGSDKMAAELRRAIVDCVDARLRSPEHRGLLRTLLDA